MIHYHIQNMFSFSPILNPPTSLHPFPSTPLPHTNTPRLRFKPGSTRRLPPSTTPHSNSPQTTPSEEEDFHVLTATKTQHNNIIILESNSSKLLLLDDTHNVHSISYKHSKWTNSYWDEFTTLPAVIPPGPIAIFGLGAGTVAGQLLHFWPALRIHGYELDEILIDKSRQFFGMSELETVNKADGVLVVHVGDALAESASVEGGYAGIIVDLFSNGKVLPELERVETWLEMKEKVMVNGRIMVNCGGEAEAVGSGGWEENLTIKAMCGAFGREFVNWKKMGMDESGNFLAFTGDLPEVGCWSEAVPRKLAAGVNHWKRC